MSTPETPQPDGPKKPQRGFMIMMAILGLAFGLPTVYSGGVMVGQAFGSGEFPAIGFIVQLALGLMLAGFGFAAVIAVAKSFFGQRDGQG
ncbi:hypothetical protein [Maricaulis sp.]|uniref:hypothetical protein n=1 Tax=Maricaulis sp. TaxID=1486257 RepID=UPI00262A46F4|nr:hypothetical protein [Maricaulis sp.]MDF1768630.1 hypothetical protein [Maricaulis sp.]